MRDEKEVIIQTVGDSVGKIDSLIAKLEDAKNKGAEYYRMTWSQDPQWAFKWFELYKVKTEEEIKVEKIKQLEEELNNLKK